MPSGLVGAGSIRFFCTSTVRAVDGVVVVLDRISLFEGTNVPKVFESLRDEKWDRRI